MDINGVTLNIVAYIMMSFIMTVRLSNKPINKVEGVFNLLFCFWSIFFSIYLIRDYGEIIVQPLNTKLNYYETITNFSIALFLIGMFFKQKNN